MEIEGWIYENSSFLKFKIPTKTQLPWGLGSQYSYNISVPTKSKASKGLPTLTGSEKIRCWTQIIENWSNGLWCDTHTLEGHLFLMQPNVQKIFFENTYTKSFTSYPLRDCDQYTSLFESILRFAISYANEAYIFLPKSFSRFPSQASYALALHTIEYSWDTTDEFSTNQWICNEMPNKEMEAHDNM